MRQLSHPLRTNQRPFLLSFPASESEHRLRLLAVNCRAVREKRR